MKKIIPLHAATKLAGQMAERINDVCERLEFAGSVRRECQDCGDIELVCIPKRRTNLLGEPDGCMLRDRLDAMLDNNEINRTRNGERWQQVISPKKWQFDIFITTPERWPIIFAIRTGDADYSRSFVTQRAKGGLLRNGCYVSDGRLYDGGAVVDLESEQHFFNTYVQGGYCEPKERTTKRKRRPV